MADSRQKLIEDRDYYKAMWLRLLVEKQQLEERFRTIRELLGIRECSGECCRDE